MNRIYLRFIGFILVFIFLNNVAPIFAQTYQPISRVKLINIQQRDDGRVAARFSVINANGNPPSSLDPSIVHLDADNQTLPASSVRALSSEGEMTPLNVVLVIDVTPTMRVDVVREQLPSIINTIQKINGSQVGIVSFSNQVLQTLPLTDNFDTITTSISELQPDTEVNTQDVNTVVLGIQAGINLLTNQQTRNVLVLLTDTVDTQPNQTSIQDVVIAANEQNIAIYSLLLPESGSGRIVDPNLSLPLALADATNGFVFPYLGDNRTHLAVSSELARSLGLLSETLSTEYEAIFNLRSADIGAQEDLAVTLRMDIDEEAATDNAFVNYSEPQYTATLMDGDGRILNDGSVVAGNIMLEFQAEPSLPDNTRYQFTAGGEIIDCGSDTTNRCVWNTNFGTQPGFYSVQATAMDDDGIIVAQVQTLLNVYREDLDVSVPSSIAGQVPIVVNIVGYEQLADQAELWLVSDVEVKRVDLQAVPNNGEQVTLYIDTEQDIFDTTDDASQDILLRIDLRNVGLNTLIARQQIYTTANRIPEYDIRLSGSELDFSPQITYLPMSNIPYQFNAEITPSLSNIDEEQFVVALDRDNRDEIEFLATTTDTNLDVTWDTSLLTPGVYRLGAAVVRDVDNLEQPVILAGEWHTINLYRLMEASTVLYSQRDGNTLLGDNQLTISTVILPEADIIAVYADDELVASTSVEDDGETSLIWDIDRTVFSDINSEEQVVDVRIDILADDGVTVLGRREETLTLRPTPEFQIMLTGIRENDTITERREITAQLDPPLSSLEVAYIFFAQPVSGQESEAIIGQDGSATAIWDISGAMPGRYLFSVQAYDRTTLDQENPQPLASSDTSVNVIKTPTISGEFTDDIFIGKNKLEVQNYPDVDRIVVEFLPEDTDKPIAILDETVQTSNDSTILDVDWQAKLFDSDQQDTLHGLVVVFLRNEAGEDLYIWVQDRSIQYDTRVELLPWRAAIWALLGIMIAGLILPLRRRWDVVKRQGKRSVGDLRKTIQTDGHTCTVSWRDPEHGIFDGIEVHSTVTLSIGRREMWWEPDIAFSSRTVSRRLGTMTLLEGGQTLKLSIPKSHHTRILINDTLMSEYVEHGYADDDSFSYENQMLILRRINQKQVAEYVIKIGMIQSQSDQCAITVML